MIARMPFRYGFLAGLLAAAVVWPAAAAEPAALGHGVFALVGKTAISNSEYDAAYNAAKREKYYHAQPPEAEIAALQREVADKLVDRVLVLEEARRRNVKPDAARVAAAIKGYEQRYAGSAQWQQNRERLLPGLTAQLELQSVFQQIEQKIRTVAAPTAQQVSAYYKAHPELFTEPEQVHIAVILLKVDPSSTRVVWDKAKEEAAAIRARIAKGAAFADLARLHSAHDSAARGGDMGYVHRGMLPEGMERLLDTMKLGVVSDPVVLLEGVALMRLDGRKLPHLRKLEEVSGRAGELWQREQAARQWRTFIAGLRKGVTIRMDPSRYPPDRGDAVKRAAVRR